MASSKVFRWQCLKVVILTSLVWVMLDVFILMHFTDCSGSSNCQGPNKKEEVGVKDLQTSKLIKVINTEIKRTSFNNNNSFEQNRFNRLKDEVKPSTKAAVKAQGFLNNFIPNILKAAAPTSPGDMGRPVVIPKAQEEEMKEKFKINQFNLIASDMIALNRTLPDVRMDACKNKVYPTALLPTTSVIIVFHNEAWSTLLRTVHSVIDRSPKELLHEILLVDDFSERDFLGRKLEKYVARLPVSVRVLRMPSRTGLIRARLKGAEEAKGNVLTFLDAHCECTQGWLEPLLYEIYLNKTSVVCPIIDVLSDDTFEYITGSDMTWGGFNWKLNFRWYPVPQREIERRGGDRSLPLRSPTMAGGLFSIDRDYFYHIGAYDPGMDIWGGENLEMSFRVWMCGGKVLISTCSRVGHVFRKVSPYTWPGGVVHILNHNTMRTVEVWMDNYKDFFYKISPGVKTTNYGDVAERRALREKLQCKSFRWYLEHIYPESQMPLDYYSLGEIRHKETAKCMDTMGRKQGEDLGMVGCHGMGGNQVFSYTMRKEIMTDDLCLDVASSRGPIRLVKCHKMGGNQEWHHNKETLALKHVNSNMCLDKPVAGAPDKPSLASCSGSPSQQWLISDMNWDKYTS